MKKIIVALLLASFVACTFCSCGTQSASTEVSESEADLMKLGSCYDFFERVAQCYGGQSYYRDRRTNLMYVADVGGSWSYMCPLYRTSNEVYTYEEWKIDYGYNG